MLSPPYCLFWLMNKYGQNMLYMASSCISARQVQKINRGKFKMKMWQKQKGSSEVGIWMYLPFFFFVLRFT